MASFRIHNDNNENNAALLRGKTREASNNQRRPVLGVVNSNAEAGKILKPHNQAEKAVLKPRLTTRSNNVLNNEKGKLAQKSNVAGNALKAKVFQPFQVFEDEPEVPKPAAVLKNDKKGRVLKDKTLAVVPVLGNDEFMPTKSEPSLPEPPRFGMPEPMSPDCAGSPMCMDVSMKSDTKSTSDAEKAAQDLACLAHQERMYMSKDYRDDIILYMKSLQRVHRPRKNYMARQRDITYNMRAVLVDWLVEVVEEYKMSNETLHLAVSYIDRFLSSMSVVRSKLQLVGTAAMFIAAKYEEIYPPDVKDFVYITDDTYTKQQVLRMEHLILRVLHFDVGAPTSLYFLSDYTTSHPMPDDVKYLAMYLCELALLQGDPYLGYVPSDVAAAALCVARATLLPDEDVLPTSLQTVLDVQLTDIIHVIAAIEVTYRAAENHAQQASRDKYKTDKYLGVASIPAPETDCSSLLSKEMSPEPHQHHHHNHNHAASGSGAD